MKTITLKNAIKKAAGSRRYSATFSDGSIDREKDVIDPKGWTYPSSVPLLLDHDHSVLMTIGRCSQFHVDGDRFRGVIELAPAGISATVDEVERRFNAGLYPDLSVGFNPIAWVPREGGDGLTFTKQELLEVSCVAIPANASATIDRGALVKWLGPLASRSRAEDDIDRTSAGRARIMAAQRSKISHTLTALSRFNGKAGRVLSAANEALIQQAIDHLEEVLGQLDADAEGGKSAALVVNGKLLAPDYRRDPDEVDLDALDARSVKAAVRRIVAERIMQLTGLVD